NPVLAQETQLEEVVVTATRIEEPKKDVPYSVQIITQEDIKTSIAKDAGDLIAESGVGHVTKYPGALTTFYLRGYSLGLNPLTARTLLLINGFRTATANIAMIPIDDIEKIEIVKGPSSVLYGSNAMGGVVNIITKKATEEGIYGYFGLEGGSWLKRKVSGELQLKKSNFDAYLMMSRSEGDDYDAKKYGRYKNTGYNDEALSLRLGYEFLKEKKFSLGFRHYRGWEIGSPGSILLLTPNDYVDQSLDSFDLSYETKTFKVGYYISKRRYEYHDNTWGTISLYKTDTQGITLQKVFNINDHRIIIGGEWNRGELENENTPPPPYQPKSKYDNFGVFSEAKISITKKLFLTLGARYDYFENELLSTPGMTMVPKKETVDYFTIRSGALYKLTDTLILRANAGTGFRAPSPDEYAGEYILWGTRFIGNPSLKPEKSINYEGGLSFSQYDFNLDFAFFHSIFKDRIASYFDTFLNAYTYKNFKKATIQGWELNLSYDLKNLLVLNFSVEPFANITYHTRFSDPEGKPITAIPKWLGAFGIRAHGKNWDARIIANYFGDENVTYYNPITW
ncbi:MAG: TonB-dependent receptor, partial [Thermodesulfovibrio sp.]|nr:TonB-dependent receptor [Thermodesulfovibrio sp.]